MTKYLCSHSIVQYPLLAGPRWEETGLATNQPVSASDGNTGMWSFGNGVKLVQLGKLIPVKVRSTGLFEYVAKEIFMCALCP